MDEKTEELRDIFMDVADDDTVTESQQDERGSLLDDTQRERLGDVVERMRDRFEFETALSSDDYCALIRRFHAGDDDAELAAALDVDEETVFAARMDCHLVRETDLDAPFDRDELADRLDDDPAAVADDLDASEATVRRCQRALRATRKARRVSYRFQEAFADAVPDAALAARLTDAAQQDGLGDATEDAEVDVDL